MLPRACIMFCYKMMRTFLPPAISIAIVRKSNAPQAQDTHAPALQALSSLRSRLPHATQPRRPARKRASERAFRLQQAGGHCSLELFPASHLQHHAGRRSSSGAAPSSVRASCHPDRRILSHDATRAPKAARRGKKPPAAPLRPARARLRPAVGRLPACLPACPRQQ